MEELLADARAGDMFALRRCGDLVAELVNAASEVDGSTLLTVAAERGHEDMVQYLLERGADPNLASTGKQSALHLCCSNRHLRIARLLLHAGAHVNHRDSYNLTPLIRAAEVGSVELVRLLVAHRAEVNQPETRLNHNTALHVACFSGHTDVCDFLLERGGAHINATNGNGNTALMLTIQHGYHKLAIRLIERWRVEVNGVNKSYLHRTPLHVACDARQGELVRALITHGAKIDVQDQAGCSSLMLAVRNNDVDTVTYLLQSGASVNLQNINMQTALMMACTKGYTKVIKLLIRYGSDVNMADNKGHTSLTTMFFYYKNKAWMRGNEGTDNIDEILTTFQTLLVPNAHVDIKDNNGFTFCDYLSQGNFVGRWSPRTLKFSTMKAEEKNICDELLRPRLPLKLSCQAAQVLCQWPGYIVEAECPPIIRNFIKMHHPTKFDTHSPNAAANTTRARRT